MTLTTIIASSVVLIVIILQITSFSSTYIKIRKLQALFPTIDKLRVKKVALEVRDMNNKEILEHIKSYKGSDVYNDSVINTICIKNKTENSIFANIVDMTNMYLYKNAGTSADFGVLKEICENRIDTMDREIQNSINVPLYLGLAGTFVGIITGLYDINFESIFNENSDLSGLNNLLNGVKLAMGASLIGLILTVLSSALLYKKAISKCETAKDDYFDFIRQELIPMLSNDVTASLNSLKGVLGHFVDRFGRNLDTYTDSASILNDNLEKQHKVLEELNKLSLTKTANKIAEVFNDLKDASDSLLIFREYQNQLNMTISNLDKTTAKIDGLINNFATFNSGLAVIVQNQQVSSTLQKQFKESMETHFPQGSEGRDVWRKEFDLLINEAKQVSDALTSQFSTSSSHIQDFITNNSDFFNTFNNIEQVTSAMVQSSELQIKCYNDLKEEIHSIKLHFIDSQKDSVEMTKSVIIAMNEMSSAIKELKKDEKK